MEEFIFFNGKKLRKGYTTGSCATAAATAAAGLLFNNEAHENIQIELPNTEKLTIPIASLEMKEDTCEAFVVKDGGDDVDATDGMLIGAKLSKNATKQIIIDGGTGIGRVTEVGLQIPVGEAAINPVPRGMIEEAVRKIIGPEQGAKVVIFAPEGASIANQTMNRRLGIIGGISILGTTGIVTPMSEEGWKKSISLELEMKKSQGYRSVILCPGNYGEDFVLKTLKFGEDKIVSMSNFVGYVLKEVQRLEFEKVLMVGHLGKLIKVSAGIFSTHSKDADARAEILIANLALLGMSVEQLKKIQGCLTTEAAGDIIADAGYEKVYPIIAKKIKYRSESLLKYRKHQPIIEVVLFSSQRGYLASTKPIEVLKEEWK
ncbi:MULTISPECIES: cobalt-precorrin-5B (C(1))-methyltransferase CbiD [Enterococcus]|uniref:Cobalt-precorrin-5B C(1)-methyltransferase n=1 Tax=Candidatus Enterococcus murrayae TaxID=2815321 RepID=A0ABS3HFC8_9ENTE|nr:cobalt-precorrin-5B (C(1))-methyltransferase CbiD [Enterococcus sp. MJM16]MBO0452137.1 cobalt-precorrin-5B (C(1))-methyltransferase [Enterococcus sp. MJM16]